MKKAFIFICFLTLNQVISSQIADASNIKSIIFQPTITNAYTPIVKLGGKLSLRFDDIDGTEQDYFYKITHCEFDWTPSNLLDSEFIVGFSKDRIRDFNNSFNTLLPYTHYQVSFPNSYTRIKLSGNYMLTVYNENEEPVFQRPFIVYEPKVTVAVSVHLTKDVSKIDTHQSVQFSINNPSFRINNPNQEIMPVILQNNNWKTAVTGLKPKFIRGNQLLYLYGKETDFWGGNEFLYFDTKAIRDPTLNIARARLDADIYHTYLYTREERKHQPYTLNEDINGNFIVRTIDGGDYQNIESDYSRVFFSLESYENLKGKNLYVSGNFNNWQLTDENKLTYNSETGLYECNMLFKQGFYNYQFLTRDEQGVISNHDIDGSFYQTENSYTVIVYYKKFGARYTQVIGVGLGSSNTILN